MTRIFVSFAIALAILAATAVTHSASAKPGWANGNECVLDDGYNRYRPCSGADGS